MEEGKSSIITYVNELLSEFSCLYIQRGDAVKDDECVAPDPRLGVARDNHKVERQRYWTLLFTSDLQDNYTASQRVCVSWTWQFSES